MQRDNQWYQMIHGWMYASIASGSVAPLIFLTCILSTYTRAPTYVIRLQRPWQQQRRRKGASTSNPKNKYSYLYLKVGYKDMIGTIGPVLIVGERRTVFLLV